MQKVLILIKKELDVAKLQAQIRQSVEKKITEHQRKFFLREQLKVIQQELGIAKDDRQADVDKFNDRLEALNEIGRAHVWTPVTPWTRMPSSAWKKKKQRKKHEHKIISQGNTKGGDSRL